MPGQNIIIRKFEPRDKDEVRRIIHDTAFMGEPAGVFFQGEKIISDSLTLYFTDYEPQSCFVAEADGKVAGCLIGTKNKAASEKVIKDKIAPYLLWEALRSGVLFKKKNIMFIINCLSSLIKGEFKMSDFTIVYPATFHINVKAGFRGVKLGSRLIEAYERYLREEDITGVHLATMSDAAAKFFFRHGFQLLHRGRRSYFRHILHRDVPLYIYGKKLYP
ncbi:MAG: GNAT family N-acetyltransferase [Candidatus Omnitrophota bacterium]